MDGAHRGLRRHVRVHADGLNVLKMLIVRGVTFGGAGDAGMDTVRDVDWTTEGYPAGQNTATVTNATAQTTLTSLYATTGDGLGLRLDKGAPSLVGATLTRVFSTVPVLQQTANDRYGLIIDDSTFATQQDNHVESYVHTAADVSIALPASFVPGFDIVATAPYAKPAFTVLTAYAGAQTYAFSWHYAPSKFVVHNFAIDVDAASLSGAAPYQFNFPDFSAVAGWNNTWAVPTAVTAGAVAVTGAASSKITLTGGFERRSSSKGSAVP